MNVRTCFSHNNTVKHSKYRYVFLNCLNMPSALIIDDEAPARNLIREYLRAFPEITVLAECENGFEAFKAIQKLRPDLLFLDVQMPRLGGFELLELLEERPSVIFTTAFDQYAVSAFEQNALDYLLKPITRERFTRALEKWKINRDKEQRQEPVNLPSAESRNRIAVKTDHELLVIPASQIHYIEAFDDYVKIHGEKGVHLKKTTMNRLEAQLDPERFLRIHRSFLVNLQELTGIEPMEKNSYLALLRNGKKIPVSRNQYAELKRKLGF